MNRVKQIKIYLAICVITTTVVFSSNAHKIVKRYAGDRPEEGYCTTFTWGGTSGVHLYACCNNKNEVTPNCDGKSYHTASSGNYCKQGGFDGGNGYPKRTYKCGGCNGQNEVSRYCLHDRLLGFYGLISNIPGFCWMFTDCFSSKCKERYHYRKRKDLSQSKCWNNKCDDGETVENCPIDCCRNINPKCKPQPKICLPEYCNTPKCFPSKAAGLLMSSYIIFIVLVQTFFNIL